jgi:ribonuclease-3
MDTEPITLEEYKDTVKPYSDGTPNMMSHYFDESIRNNWVPFQQKPYEILEFLGDSILSTVITDYMIERYPDQNEEFLTKLKTQLVRGTNLCILAKRLAFDRYLLISRKTEQLGLRQNDDVLEDVLEAFIGAIFTDFGRHATAFGICKDFIVRLMERYLNMNQMARRRNNYKDLLLQYFHKTFGGENPKYQLLSTHGPTNNRTFKAAVINTDGHMITTGEGSKLVFAEQEAAKEALKYYGQEVYSDSEEPDHQVYTYSDIEDD